MKPRSFRIRIALLVVALSGLVLVGFGGAALALVYRMRLDALDREIKGRVHPHLTQHEDARGWADLEKAVRFSYGARKEGEIVLLACEPSGGIRYQSAEWPGEIQWDSLPLPRPSAVGPAPERDSDSSRPRTDRPRAEKPPPEGRAGPRLQIRPPVFVTRSASGRRWRIGVIGNPEVTLAVAVDLSMLDGEMRQTAMAFLLVLPVALLLVAAGGWWIAQRALRPVSALTRTAEQITAKGLDQRIVVDAADAEFLRLITVFNQMLDRLQSGFQQAVRFSADAAHELKTPLTILQGELEHALQNAAAGSKEQCVLNALLEEVQRLRSIVRKLLLLSLADSGQLKLSLERLNLSEMLEETCDDTGILAPHLTVKKDLAPDLWVMSDRDLIRQVIQNLATNAVKHNQDRGMIEFRLHSDGAMVRFVIANSGEPIAPADRDKIFDRFFRGDRSRSRRVEGVGLGLSLSREIVRAHKGDLVLEDGQDGRIVFAMTLPAAPLDS